MKVEQPRSNVFTVTATHQELSALVAGARMSLELMQAHPNAPREAIELLERVLREYDTAIARLKGDGRSSRPSPDPPDSAA